MAYRIVKYRVPVSVADIVEGTTNVVVQTHTWVEWLSVDYVNGALQLHAFINDTDEQGVEVKIHLWTDKHVIPDAQAWHALYIGMMEVGLSSPQAVFVFVELP